MVHAWDVDFEVIVHKSQSVFDGVNLGSEYTFDKLLRRLLQDRPIKNGRHGGLDIVVKLHYSVIKRDSGPVHPPKHPLVDGRLYSIHTPVDIVRIGCRLVVHAIVDGCGNGVGEIGYGGCGSVRVFCYEWAHGKELDLDREEAKETDEEAGERWGMEDVVEEPLEVGVL